MRCRLVVPLLFIWMHPASYANIEWPALFSFRPLEFMESLVRACDASFPAGAPARQIAFTSWRSRNQVAAARMREFTIARVLKSDPKIDPGSLEPELDRLQQSALSQASTDEASWGTVCEGMASWLKTEESDVERQVPEFAVPR